MIAINRIDLLVANLALGIVAANTILYRHIVIKWR